MGSFVRSGIDRSTLAADYSKEGFQAPLKLDKGECTGGWGTRKVVNVLDMSAKVPSGKGCKPAIPYIKATQENTNRRSPKDNSAQGEQEWEKMALTDGRQSGREKRAP